MSPTIISIFDQCVRTRPNDIFLTDESGSYTYLDIYTQSLSIANYLLQHGLHQDQPVGLYMFNRATFVSCLLGAWRISIPIVPINHKFKAPEIEYVVNHASIKCIFYDNALHNHLASLPASVHLIPLYNDNDDNRSLSVADILRDVSPTTISQTPLLSTLAEILYTSGTTGKPKGCLHTHSTVYQAALLSTAGFQLTNSDRILIAMPIWHSSPLNNWLLGSILSGASVYFIKEYEPRLFVDALSRYRITLTFGSPIAFILPAKTLSEFSSYDLTHLRSALFGGGPLGRDMTIFLNEKYGTGKFSQVYGMTETGPNGTALYSWESEGHEGSIGRCGTPGMEIEVRTKDGHVCTHNCVGEIYIRSPAMMIGYLNDIESTNEVLDAAGWYKTGDIARLDESGYLYILDRAKDMIITGGENVYSKEVEDVLSSCPGVFDVAVVGVPHAEWGETVTAIIVRDPNALINEESVIQYANARLARYKVPRFVMFRTQLPRTPSGKLMKYRIRAELLPHFS